MYGFCGVWWYGKHIIPYGMVCYVSKQKQKDNLETFGSVLEWVGNVLESFECVSSALGPYVSVWQARQAGQPTPICLYGM